jgi:hypothetical protein
MQVIVRPAQWRRFIIAVAVSIAMVGGIAFAALQSQQLTLTGNTIATATANLKLSTDNTNYAYTSQGFTFSGLVPGGPAVPQYGNLIYLKNLGDTQLQLKLAVKGTPSNPDAVDLSKVSVVVTYNGSNTPQTFSLQQLVTAYSSGGVVLTPPTKLYPSSVASYSMQVSMTADAVTSPSAAISGIDFVFSGEVAN